MLSKGFSILGIFILIQVIAFSFLTDLKPIALGGAIIVLMSSLVMTVLSRKEPVSQEMHIPPKEKAPQAESMHVINGTAMLVAAAFFGLRLMYYNLVDHYGSSEFRETCILIMGIASLIGGIVLKLRYRKKFMEQANTKNMNSGDNDDIVK